LFGRVSKENGRHECRDIDHVNDPLRSNAARLSLSMTTRLPSVRKTRTAPVIASGRAYTNTHREAQAAKTREEILNALVRVMARGVAELSIPAVATEAGVAIRTVYRNFPTKRELVAALDTYLDERIGFSLSPVPSDPAALIDLIRRYFKALDGMDDTIRAARTNRIAREARDTAGVPDKLHAITQALAPIASSLALNDRSHLFNVIATLFSQYTLQRMKEDLDLTADAAAESVVWAVQILVDAATRKGTGKPER
jgi:AcrR family transcriptional regulator